MPRPPENLDSRRFEDLTVRHITDHRNNRGRRLYECQCKCGATVYATAANLKRGEIKRCKSCQRARWAKNLTGQRFERLVARAPAIPDEPHGPWKWVCDCDCGKRVTVSSADLLSGNTASCGCAQRDAIKALYVDGTAPCKLTESAHPRKTNKSGVTGVYFDNGRNQWAAEIMFRRKKYYLGRYSKKEDAVAARKDAESHMFGDFLDWYKHRSIVDIG